MVHRPSEMRKDFTGNQGPHRTVELKKKKKKKKELYSSYLKLTVHVQITNSMIIYNYFSNRLLLHHIISFNPLVSSVCTTMRIKGGRDVFNTSFWFILTVS